MTKAIWSRSESGLRARLFAAQDDSGGEHRLADPTLNDRGLAIAEQKFVLAIDEFQRRSGRTCLTWGEVLQCSKGSATRRLTEVKWSDPTLSPSRPDILHGGMVTMSKSPVAVGRFQVLPATGLK